MDTSSSTKQRQLTGTGTPVQDEVAATAQPLVGDQGSQSQGQRQPATANQGQSTGVGQQAQVVGMVQTQPVARVGTVAKEQEPWGGAAREIVVKPEMVEQQVEMELPPEVREYVEKVEKENLELKREVVHKGEVVVAPAQSSNLPQVVLPMTAAGFSVGMKQKVVRSARWLAEWCLKLMKRFHGRVVYSSEQAS